MSSSQKKRNRHTVVCTFCKKRKLKCDKAQPCSSCIKFGKDECIYENLGINHDYKIAKTTQAIRSEIIILSNRIKKLERELPSPMPLDIIGADKALRTIDIHNDLSTPETYSNSALETSKSDTGSPRLFSEFLGKNPIAKFDDKISFEELAGTSLYRNRLRRAHSALTCFSFMKSDTILSPFLSYLHYAIVIRNTKIQPLLKDDLKQLEASFESKNDDINGVGDIRLYSENPASKDEVQNKNKSITFNRCKYFDGPDFVERLSKEIAAMLPSNKTIWDLIDIFFAKFYPVFPILDQKDFIQAISKLIGQRNNLNNKISSIKVEKRIDFSFLGLLLIILRLSYLVIISTGSPKQDKHIKEDNGLIHILANDPITIDAYFLSKKCLELFDLLNTSSTTVFQLALLHRIYLMYAPEEGDDGERESEATGFNGIITNAAIGLGFNRERTFSFAQTNSVREKNLHRKLWDTVSLLNVHNSVYSGSRLALKDGDSDSMNPFIEQGNQNIYDSELEVAVMESYSYRNVHVPHVAEILHIVSNVREKADMYRLSKILEVLETDVLVYYGRTVNGIHEYHGTKGELNKLLELIMYLQVIFIDVSLLTFFLNYYEKKKDSKMVLFYAKKIVITLGYEFAPLCYKILIESPIIFPNFGDFFILPDIITNMYKMCIVLLSFNLRVKADIFQYSKNNKVENDPKLLCMEDCTYLLQITLKNMLDRFINQSARYYAAWASSKQIAIFYDFMLKDDVFEFEEMSCKWGFMFTEHEYKEFNQILTTVSANLNEVWKQLEKTQLKDKINDIPSDKSNIPTANKSLRETLINTEIDRIWEEVLQVKTDNQKPNDLENIANYEDTGLVGDSYGFPSFDNTFFDGPSLDHFFKTYIDDN